MRALLVCSVLLWTLAASAQQELPSAPQPTNWQSVQQLPVGASVHVKARSGSIVCRVQSVGADSLTCAHANAAVYRTADIRSIKRTHRARSAVVGAVLGLGIGAVIGAALGPSCSAAEKASFLGCFQFVTRADFALLGGGVGVLAGTPIGYFTDFTRSTVYKSK